MERFVERSSSAISLFCCATRRRSAATTFRNGVTVARTSFLASRRISPFKAPAKFGTFDLPVNYKLPKEHLRFSWTIIKRRTSSCGNYSL